MIRALERLPAVVRMGIAVAVGLLVGIPRSLAGDAVIGIACGWTAFCLAWILLVWMTLWPMGVDDTRTHALREDPSRTVADVLLVLAPLASLGAVAALLLQHATPWTSLLAVLAVAGSWGVVHTTFATRYARIYHGEGAGGVEFGGTEAPTYSDFAYLAFTVGMCYQVSDTQFTSRAMRKVALRQSFLAYLFGSVVIASTINLVAGLGS